MGPMMLRAASQCRWTSAAILTSVSWLLGETQGESEFLESVLYYEARLRPALRALAKESEFAAEARGLPAMFAVPEDLQLIVQQPIPPSFVAFDERWRYAVATALISPKSEAEWSFLKRGAFNEFDDRWADAGAIQTLMLTASSRSQTILEEAAQKNDIRARMIARALAYIKSKPVPLADSNLKTLAQRVAQIIKIGKWVGNGKAKFNEGGDIALVDFNFKTAENMYTNTGTFHRIHGVWVLRGVHETFPGMILPPVPVPKGL